MSSHREAPEISKDPVADNTDVYAFVSPDRRGTVTLIANFIPLQKPDGGPNFYEFGDDVLYEIHVANRRKAEPNVTYQFRFTTRIRNRNTFLYNTGPINNVDDESWNRPQTYSVTRVRGRDRRVLAPWTHLSAGERRGPQHARLRGPRRADHPHRRMGVGSSPASEPRASTSTSAASSTSAPSVPSSRCT